MKKLRDRVAVVTGAGSGIGRAVAQCLGDKGCHLALCDVDDEGLAETKTMLNASGKRISTHHVDVSSRDEMERFARDVESEHGAVHIVVNNAGVGVAKTFEDHTFEDLEWIFGVNLWGVVHGCKVFLPMLQRADEGHIVNISSVFGLVGYPMNSSYCATKFAVRGLSESLRVELEASGIGVTSVHPGGIATNVAAHARWSEDDKTQDARDQTMRLFKGFLPPQEAARLIVRGIERNEPKVLITKQAHVVDTLLRVSPGLLREILRRKWAKYLRTGVVEV